MAGHFGTECGKIDGNVSPRRTKSHFEVFGRKKFAMKIELLTSHRIANDLYVLLNSAQWVIKGLPMPFGDGRIGRTDTQQKTSRRKLIKSHCLKRQRGRRSPEDVIDRRAYFETSRGSGDGSQHDRRVLVICLATPCAIKSMFLRKLSKLRNGVHRQLGAGIEFDIDLHEPLYVNTNITRNWPAS